MRNNFKLTNEKKITNDCNFHNYEIKSPYKYGNFEITSLEFYIHYDDMFDSDIDKFSYEECVYDDICFTFELNNVQYYALSNGNLVIKNFDDEYSKGDIDLYFELSNENGEIIDDSNKLNDFLMDLIEKEFFNDTIF